MQVLDRFLKNVKKTSSCWIWVGYSKNGRYGSISMDGRQQQAHVVAFKLLNGPVTDGMIVMHRCDTTLCVNPRHLKPGTHSDNMVDCVAKGRFRKPAPYKLTQPGTHAKILGLLKKGISQRTIAAKFNVTQSRICQINRSYL